MGKLLEADDLAAISACPRTGSTRKYARIASRMFGWAAISGLGSRPSTPGFWSVNVGRSPRQAKRPGDAPTSPGMAQEGQSPMQRKPNARRAHRSGSLIVTDGIYFGKWR